MLKGKNQVMLVNHLKGGRIVLEQDERLTYVFFGTEGWEKSVKLEFHLKGEGAELNFYAFIIGRGVNSFPFETVIHHIVGNNKSNIHLRAALFDESIVDYKGNLVIDKSAQMVDTYLAHHSLLLSEKARTKTIPSMEIEANDVKAGHAATIGKVNKDLLFYFKSRGIDEKVAESLLISGFFETQIQMILDEDVQADVRKMVIESLPFPTKFNTLV